ncbi:PBSX family phage terminase large subunit [Cumulibacter soli]|uniref:PBSX family phage terminase large subunit n=1 Tax=Cumulibacter soli TaxID=2546344 RepID=UPI00106817E0|nr:PBSX family phage terminase large subunit [Cumulibacter soli]
MKPAKLSRKQRVSIRDTLRSPDPLHLWEGAVRSGKTTASVLAWCAYVDALAPPGPLIMIGKTKDTIRRNVLDEIDAYFGDASPLAHTAGANEGRLFGRRVHMVGANDAKAESRIRGLTLAGAYVDEATLLPNESYWSMLETRHITTFSQGAKIFATTNPDSPAHWLKRKKIDKAREIGMRTWHFTLDDNPALDEQEKARLKRSLAGLFYKRFIDGLWVAAEGAIFEALSEEANTTSEVTGAPALIALDYGTLNPTHAVLLHVDKSRRRITAASEWRHDGRNDGQLTDGETSAKLGEWVKGLGHATSSLPIVVDPSAASFRQQLRRDGWTVRSADNTVLDGIRSVAALFKNQHLVVHRADASALWDELLGYVWDEKAADDGEDRPVKLNDHGVDALRYGVMALRSQWRSWLAPAPVPEGDGEFVSDSRRRIRGLTRSVS